MSILFAEQHRLEAKIKELEAEVEQLTVGIRDAIEVLERNSTSAPVLEALRTLVTKP